MDGKIIEDESAEEIKSKVEHVPCFCMMKPPGWVLHVGGEAINNLNIISCLKGYCWDKNDRPPLYSEIVEESIKHYLEYVRLERKRQNKWNRIFRFFYI